MLSDVLLRNSTLVSFPVTATSGLSHLRLYPILRNSKIGFSGS